MTRHGGTTSVAERLARSTPSEIEDARRSVAVVLTAATELVRLLPADGADQDPVWQLARRLALVPGAAVTDRATPSLAVADAAFRAALVGSLDAIRMCRQTLHVSRACWFADVPGADGCGEVLRIAHALS